MKKLAIFLVLALAAFVAMPAQAQDTEFNPYGSARIASWWVVSDVPDPGDDDEDLLFDLQGNSRFGARFKAGDIAGRIEYGTGVNLRLLYGEWNFGPDSKIQIGQNYTPAFWFADQAADGDWGLIGYGMAYDGRQPQIRLEIGGFRLVFVRPSTPALASVQTTTTTFNDVPVSFVSTSSTAGDVDTTVPKTYVGYNFRTANFQLYPSIAYNGYEVEIGGNSVSIDSWLLQLNGQIGMGMATLRFSGWYGTNLGNFGLVNVPSARAVATSTVASTIVLAPGGTVTTTVSVPTEVEDVETWGAYLQVGFKAGTTGINLGWGYSNSSADPYAEDDAQQSYYVQANIPFTKGFFIVPEFSYFDRMDNTAGVEEADQWWLGLKWQINF